MALRYVRYSNINGTVTLLNGRRDVSHGLWPLLQAYVVGLLLTTNVNKTSSSLTICYHCSQSTISSIKMANVDVIEEVANTAVQSMSPNDIDEKTKKLAEEIKEKANACFKSICLI